MLEDSNADCPLISVITPLYWPKMESLTQLLESVKNPRVEHILVLDGTENVDNLSRLKKIVKKFGATLLIGHKHQGISKTINIGINVSKGEFILLVDQDDFLENYWFAAFEIACSNADIIYSDTTTRFEDGVEIHSFQKPAWSPIRLIYNMYASHFFAFRKKLLEQTNLLDSNFDGSQDHELALRLTSLTSRVINIPLPLYNWVASATSTANNPASKPYAYVAGEKAAQVGLQLNGLNAVARTNNNFPGTYYPEFTKRKNPISVVIPSSFKKDAFGTFFISNCITSLENQVGSIQGDEIIVVSGPERNSDDFIPTKDSSFSHSLVNDMTEFNFSRRVNIGIASAKNDLILLLNDDVELLTEGALNTVSGYITSGRVGLVGALLLFPDFSVQHGGHSYDKLPHHVHYKKESQIAGFFDLVVDHEVSGVTGAFMAFSKKLWKSVGGFSEIFPNNFNDVDFCQKIRLVGQSILQANSIVCIHHESMTRNNQVDALEIDLLMSRWKHYFFKDDYAKSQ